jgi:hypothetical protein
MVRYLRWADHERRLSAKPEFHRGG